MSARAGYNQGPWQIKRVNSVTGPVGTYISDAIRYRSLQLKNNVIVTLQSDMKLNIILGTHLLYLDRLRCYGMQQ